ncbi:MAG: hypothetical protein ABII64_02320 [Elusimicrobiota bacterium]
MEISAKEYIKIMHKNFGYEIVKTKLGDGVRVDPFTAFIYSSVTGAGYLDDPLYLFTPKGLLKIFYNALDYNLITGLFEHTTLTNTPYIISKSKVYLFNSDKIIVPVEFKSEMQLQSILKQFVSELEEPSTNYIIQRIEKSKKGNGMEPFMEYLACEAMKTRNYIVENQIPLSHNTGSPDFGGYLINSRIAFNKIHLIELSLIRLGLRVKTFRSADSPYCIVGEAKTSTTQMSEQIEKYIRTKYFNECFEIHPFKIRPSNAKCGLITIGKDYTIKIIDRKSSDVLYDVNKQSEYVMWLTNYIKYYLVANLTNDEFLIFYKEKKKRKITCVKDIIEFVNSLSFDEIMKKIEVVCNGSVQ